MRRKKMPRTLATPLDEAASSRDANIVENLVSLFAPDVLLGYDYEIAYCVRERAPEEELMATVLEQTVADFQRYFLSQDEKGRKYFLAAEEWFSEDDSDWVFSFINCCAVLGIEPGYLRRGLARWKQNSAVKKLFIQAA